MHTVPCEHLILLCTCTQHTHIYRIHTCIYTRTFVISSHPRHREMHVHYIVVNKLRTDWKIRTGKFKANFQFKLWYAIMLYHCFISRYQSLKPSGLRNMWIWSNGTTKKAYRIHDDVTKWKGFRVTGPLWGDPPTTNGFPSQRASNADFDVLFDVSLEMTK